MRLIDADELIYDDIDCADGSTYMVVHAPRIDHAPTAFDVDEVMKKFVDKISALEKLDTSEEIVDVAIKELQWAMDVIKAEINQQGR